MAHNGTLVLLALKRDKDLLVSEGAGRPEVGVGLHLPFAYA